MIPVIAGLVDFIIALGIYLLFYGITYMEYIMVTLFILTDTHFVWNCGYRLYDSISGYRHAINFLSQLMLYAPVVWPMSLLKDKFGDSIAFWYGLYPMAGVIEGFRYALIGQNIMQWNLVLLGGIAGIILFVSGALYFKHKERIFADVA